MFEPPSHFDPAFGRFSERAVAFMREHWQEPSPDPRGKRSLRRLAKNGFEVNDFARRVLRDFGGRFLWASDELIYRIDFDVAHGIELFRADHVFYLQALVGEGGCPVAAGYAHVVLANPSGAVDLLSEEWLTLVRCPTLAEFFELVLFNDRSTCSTFDEVKRYEPDRS
jgi:hypothetical protein